MTCPVAPIAALVHCAPDFFEALTERDRAILPHMLNLWLRPEQRIGNHDWRFWGFICGRGWGKTFAIAYEINRRVEAGEAHCVALMGPNEDRVEEVQIKALIETSPPWFRPVRYAGGLVWPNGVRAYVYTAEAPEVRGPNFDLTWLTEIVAWPASTRRAAFDNITTATREGSAQVFFDTTSKGKNEVIRYLLDANAADPDANPIVRGSMFDNPQLGRKYLRSELAKYIPGSRKHGEEIMGQDYDEAEGALWHQEWIDNNRRPLAPDRPRVVLVSIDPAISLEPGADDTGLMIGSSDDARNAYIEEDLSGRLAPEEWCRLSIDACLRPKRPATGIVIERNRGGDVNIALLRTQMRERGVELRLLENDRDTRPFPPRQPGVIFVKQKWSATSKASRAAGPASHGEAGHVHHVGNKDKFLKLETELTEWVPGTRLSPNRLDAHAYLILELCDLDVTRPARSASNEIAAAAEGNRQLTAMVSGQRRVGL